MKVLKFGGSSVGSPDRIKKIAQIIKEKKSESDTLIVVFSAFGGITDQLIHMGKQAASGDMDYKTGFNQLESRHLEAARELLTLQRQTDVLTQIKIQLNELDEILHGVFLVKELTPKTLDYIMSFGERLSAYIINEVFVDHGLDSEFVDARNIILTDDEFGRARIRYEETNKNIKSLLKNNHKVYTVTGFIGATRNKETTTIGRGGSDFTASIFGAILEVDEIEIWTDVNGVLTADPTKVPNAFSIKNLSYEEAMEMSHFGAKVIYPPTMQPALDKQIPIRVMNTLNPEFSGTLISHDSGSNKHLIKGLSTIDNICLMQIQGSGMIGVAGIAQRIFNALALKEINIILISQASSEHSICLAVMPEHATLAKKAVEHELRYEIRDKQVNEISIEKDLAILAVVGENMRKTRGIAGKVFGALGKNGVNIVAIAQGSSELNISMVINRHDEAKAVNTLHDAFFLSETKTIHLYLAGTGLIGREFIELIKREASRLAQKQRISIKIVAIANSRKMILNTQGIDLEKWSDQLDNAKVKSDIDILISKMVEFNLPNSVFVDCTANDTIPMRYLDILKSSISIATPNKIANSVSFEFYKKLRDTAQENNVKFLYETNVGAALPVINTIQDLVSSGDRVLRLEGILSGTLSYVFNSYDEKIPFSQVIKKAQQLGYTEPDPREDLKGMDVARKLLILLREAGYQYEPEDVEVEKIISDKVENAPSVEKAFEQLEKENDLYAEKLRIAKKKGKVLRYLAVFDGKNAKVGLESLPLDHPLAQLKGTENMIAIYSHHYGENPLIVRGPGAGKEVTASGVFADVLRIANAMI
jgi:bifunctional aspartokinase / homoserine dehydrogenase 1